MENTTQLYILSCGEMETTTKTAEKDGEYNTTLYIVLWGNGNHHKDSREGWRIQHNFIYCPVRKWKPPQRQQRRMENTTQLYILSCGEMETTTKTAVKDGEYNTTLYIVLWGNGNHHKDSREGWRIQHNFIYCPVGKWKPPQRQQRRMENTTQLYILSCGEMETTTKTAEKDGEYNTTLYIVLWGNGNHHKDSREGWRIQHNFIYCPVGKWKPPQRQQRRMENTTQLYILSCGEMETTTKTAEKDGEYNTTLYIVLWGNGNHHKDSREGWRIQHNFIYCPVGKWKPPQRQQRRMEDGDSPDNREGQRMETALTTEKDGEWRQF